MIVSYNWLKEYIDIRLAPEKLAEILTMAGLSVASVRKIGGDHSIEIEVTSNRPDWLSMIGIGREVSALTGEKLAIPPLAKRAMPSQKKDGTAVRVEEKVLCARYTARIIRNVKVAESPAWLKTKLEAVGLRPVNNIVDITNFCLFETGEPMHAFDLDKIAGAEIVVRKAKKGEKITTIDGAERELDDSHLVIADRQRPIAIAGVMGALTTEVTAATKNILLEAASFDPVSIRRTSRKLGLSSESSYRFERRVDIDNIRYASDRALDLICEIAGGEAGEIVEIGPEIKGKKEVVVRPSRLSALLGVEIPHGEVERIMTALGLKIRIASKEKLELEIPHFRHDLESEVDLIEEVARIYGYDKMPRTIPPTVEQPVRRPTEMVISTKIKETLAAMGLDEIMTYSLMSRKIASMARTDERRVVEIANPLSSEQEVMRPSLLPGLLQAMLWNINRRTKDLKLFELGKRYETGSEDSFLENPTLSIGVMGQVSAGWIGASRPASFFDLKGIIENLLSELGIHNSLLKETDDKRLEKGCRAALVIKGEIIGTLGQVELATASDFDIKDKVYAAELDIGVLSKHARLEKRFTEPPRYPSVTRDISIVVGREALNGEILASINETAGPLLKGAKLIDRYVGGQIPYGKVGLTYRLEYQDQKRTLEEKDVQEAHTGILASLERVFGAKLR